ncbi:GNAT family N-acetyltransferase [Synechococcus sp. UW179A]|uniref:GNAT family N-acetyltransferase n=1 Tax=Synechococcus sp. UW179A TaxID=2575510 RepID=UPI000E0E4D30|nr:GNAT family N-acetyltransferase [Synechococcus sp. UW179A]
MASEFTIRPVQPVDIPLINNWARSEGFAPGSGDIGIYRQTDRQGIWTGCLGEEPIGCIAGIRYNHAYGFIGLYIVRPDQRGRGYGVKLWREALDHLHDVSCIGLEAAENRIDDYFNWGFQPASTTTRWQLEVDSLPHQLRSGEEPEELRLMHGDGIPEPKIQIYDADRELNPRPHFLSDWLKHPAGTVTALLDSRHDCHGFARIRPCLLKNETGWRIGPLLADSPELAELLIRDLLSARQGLVIIDSPGGNALAAPLLQKLGFTVSGRTLRMYRGVMPSRQLDEVYGLACLELG